MKILFLTTHNLATNPRLYREIILAKNSGYKVEIICFEFNNWSNEINMQMKQQLENVKIISIPAGRNPLLPWFWSVVTESIFRFAGKLFPLPVSVLSQAISRRSNLLIKHLSDVSDPDWVIGHNPGSIWPALKAAYKLNCKVGFDVEDYHPGEGDNTYLQALVKRLMVRLLPKMDYISFAAPLIFNQVKTDVHLDTDKCLTVLNYFPSADFLEPAVLKYEPLQLVWFSQNISGGRGLELILPFVKKEAGKMVLHLVGNLDNKFYENFLKGIPNITIHMPMTQRQLHQSLRQFDIGLALEPAKDRNNELAVSNKILAYLQAGLYVVATNTPAQELFLNEIPEHGICFNYKSKNAEEVFEKIMKEINILRSNKSKRYLKFKNKNWEKASLDLISTWNK